MNTETTEKDKRKKEVILVRVILLACGCGNTSEIAKHMRVPK